MLVPVQYRVGKQNCLLCSSLERGERHREEGEMAQKKLGGGRNRGKKQGGGRKRKVNVYYGEEGEIGSKRRKEGNWLRK